MKDKLTEPMMEIPYAAHEALMDRAERRTKSFLRRIFIPTPRSPTCLKDSAEE